MKNIFTIVVLIVLVNTAIAKTIIVSDIDDTIKISAIRSNIVREIFNVFKKNYFYGMPYLYTELMKMDNDSSIYYLSNAPKKIMYEHHAKLLKKGRFPKGTISLRRSIFNKKFKFNYLKRMIENQNPDRLILIGDIGEQDAIVYNKIYQQYPQIEIHQFIRQLYSGQEFNRKIHQGQTVFVTPIEIALYFNDYNQNTRFDNVISSTLNKMKIDNYKYFNKNIENFIPRWQQCRDFLSRFNNITKDFYSDVNLDKYIKFINIRCFNN